MKNPLNHKTEWMGHPDEPLTGFSWKSGANRDTTGIIFWSDVFLHKSETTGEKLAIYIVDSQGLFDSQTLPADNSRIFTLSTLMASIQILNIKSNVQENQLQYLQVSLFETQKSNHYTNPFSCLCLFSLQLTLRVFLPKVHQIQQARLFNTCCF